MKNLLNRIKKSELYRVTSKFDWFEKLFLVWFAVHALGMFGP